MTFRFASEIAGFGLAARPEHLSARRGQSSGRLLLRTGTLRVRGSRSARIKGAEKAATQKAAQWAMPMPSQLPALNIETINMKTALHAISSLTIQGHTGNGPGFGPKGVPVFPWGNLPFQRRERREAPAGPTGRRSAASGKERPKG